MNHIYRVIWNRIRHAFVVVAENARSHTHAAGGAGRGPVGALGIFVLTSLSALIVAQNAHAAGVEVASGNTQVYQAPNGVQVIDIATANAAGVSHNRYIHYNVDPSGQVLNNNSAFSGRGPVQTQLAGQLVPNANLNNEARVILNEVVAPNRSQLNGFLEVAGGTADVVVANPYGITCSGCGFINTDRATLSSGIPVIGSNGALTGLQVREGDVTVSGSGLDARNAQLLSLVARQVILDGQVNGQTVQASGGAQDYDYSNQTATAAAANSAAPMYAVDSTALGGMYANRIQLLATESGVGVRMRGEAAATADDFTISASGKIEINNRISAERDLQLSSGANSTAIELNADVSSKRDLSLTANNGGTVELKNTLLSAERDVSLTAASVVDNVTAGQRYAGRDLSVTSTGSTQLAGSSWGAGDDLSISAASINVSGNAQLYSGKDSAATGKSLTLTTTSGDLALNQGTVQSGAGLTLNAAQALNVGASSSVKSAGNYEITAAGAVTNNGQIIGSQTGKVESTAGAVTNNNLIHAAGDLLVKAATSVSNTANAGASSLQRLQLQGHTLDNSGQLYAGTAVELTASDTLRNRASGRIDSNGSLTSSSDKFINNGDVVTMGNMTINATSSFVNETLLSDGSSFSKIDGTKTYTTLETNDGVAGHPGRQGVKLANEGALDAGINLWINKESVTYNELLANGATMPTKKAQLIAVNAGSTLTVNYGNSGHNKAAVISAPNVLINGNGSAGAKFVNEELNLYAYDKLIHWFFVEDQQSGADDLYTTWANINPDIPCYWNAGSENCSGKTSSGPNGPDDDGFDINWNPNQPGGPVAWLRGQTRAVGDYTPALGAEMAAAARTTALTNARPRTEPTLLSSSGAGVYATNLVFSGGAVENKGNPWPSYEGDAGQTAAQKAAAAIRQNITGAAPSVTAPGVSTGVSLPTNPNGYFVPTKNPGARYLVETNPMFSVGANFVGSDYLAKLYGFNPDSVQTRLGDANYEGYLIRQQLIDLTGSNVIAGYNNEADQMQQLMDQAYNQAQKLGLEFGKAPTAEQLAALSEDIVWMEEVEVDGQLVLAPKVYLAPTTLDSIDKGAVIAAKDLSITGDGLSNTGGTISGSNSVTINTSGDISNLSGTIKGGDVSLSSTEGSITNQTLALTAGDSGTAGTAIGKTAGIQSTGNLSLDAAEDIRVIGAQVSAAGDAALSAGGDIVVDTIVDKNAVTITHDISGGSRTLSVATETNIGSQLDIGGNLTTRSGGNTTIAGSEVNVGGDLDASADGSFEVLARQDKATVSSQTTQSGLGVGGGVWGVQVTTQNDFTGTNVGSTLNVGGNAKVDAAEQIVLQGSDVNIGGDADLTGQEGIAILDGLDEERSFTRVETVTLLKLDKESKASAGTEVESKAEDGEASGKAKAEASASGSADLKLMETTTTTTVSGSRSSVASNLNVGGNLNMTSDGTVTVQGSNVAAGGDLNVDAKNLEVLTGRNESWESSETKTTSIGLYTEGEAKAEASAEGSASAKGAVSGEAKVSASAEGTATVGMRNETERSMSYDLTNSSSTLTSGGNMRLNAAETATFQGAEVESGGDMSIEAQNIRNLAAQDVSISSESSESHTAGFYVGASANAEAEVSAGVDARGIQHNTSGASANAGVSVEVSAGVRQSSSMESSESLEVTQVTNSFKSGGDFSRKATDTIVDQGTQVSAEGNLSQEARVIRDEAVSDYSYEKESSHEHEIRVGAYAGAGAEGGTDGGESSTGYGFKASAEMEREGEEKSSSTARTSSFSAGGDINSKSTEKTSLIGAQFSSGGDINIEAGSFEMQAARDTSSKKENSSAAALEVTAGVGEVEVGVGVEFKNASESSDTARVGSLQSGGNINIKTAGDVYLEGTELGSDGDIAIDAGGNVELAAARNKENSSSNAFELSVGGADAGDEGNSKSFGVGLDIERAKSDEAEVARLGAGGNISIKSGGNTTLEGTMIGADGDVDVEAGGKVDMKKAQSTSSEFALGAGYGMEKSVDEEGKKEKEQETRFSLHGDFERDSQGTEIESGGRTTIKQGQR